MGKCYSVKRKRYRPYNEETDRHQLTQQEKCDFLMSIKNDPEAEVVRKIKANPDLLSCFFWFEYYTTETINEQKSCTCSRALELCYQKDTPSDEMVKRLELSITTTRCPHVALAKAGRPVSCKQDISSSEVSRTCDNSVPLGVCSPKKFLTAGLYCVHLAAIYDKKEIINHVLPFADECDISNDCFQTFMHRFSPLNVALANKKFEIAVSMVTIDPRNLVSFTFRPENNIEDEFLTIPVNRNLEFNHLDAFKKLFTYSASWIYKDWPCWVIKFFQDGCTEMVNFLLSIKYIPLEYYETLLRLVHQKGLYRLCDKIVEESDIRIQLRVIPAAIGKFDEAMVKAVFSNEAHVVQLFIDIGLNKDAELMETSLLAWAEYFEFNDVAHCLKAAKAKLKVHSYTYSMLHLLVDVHNDFFFPALDYLPQIHRIYQIKTEDYFEEDMVIDVLDLAWRDNKYDIFQYLLLQGANPRSVVKRASSSFPFSLLYHLFCANTFVDGNKLLNSFGNHNAVSLSIIDEVSSFPLTYPTIGLTQDGDGFNNFDKLWWEWYKSVRPLSVLCRRTLRKHFKRHLYYRFLETQISVLPKPIMNFLTMSELQSQIGDCFPPTREFSYIYHNNAIKRARKCLGLDSCLFEN